MALSPIHHSLIHLRLIVGLLYYFNSFALSSVDLFTIFYSLSTDQHLEQLHRAMNITTKPRFTPTTRQERVKNFVYSEKYSDLVIECQGVRFPVHKTILCSQSSVLSVMLDDPAWAESQTGVLHHDLFDVYTLSMMLLYAYYGYYDVRYSPDYLLKIKNVEGKPNARVNNHIVPTWITRENYADDDHVNENMMSHVKVYSIADYYDMPELKEQAEMQFESMTPELSDPNRFIALMNCIVEHLPDNQSAMFDHVVDIAQKHDCSHDIWADPILLEGFKNEPSMQRLAGSLIRPITKQARDLSLKLLEAGRDCNDFVRVHKRIRQALDIRPTGSR